MTASQGQFVWHELVTSDAAAAEAFYRAVIGWKAADAGMEGFRYTILKVGDKGVGGLMAFPPEGCPPDAHPAWLGYIWADDVDALTARVKTAGGAIHREPADIPNIGRFSVVSDPQGAVFMLFRANGEGDGSAPLALGTPGTVGWAELHAGDGPKAFDFYADLFGWTKADAMDMGPMGVYQLFAAGAAPIGGMMTKTPEFPQPAWLYYFNVDGIDAAIARVKDNGGQIINGPHEVPGGSWIVQCLDPQGAMFCLVAPKR